MALSKRARALVLAFIMLFAIVFSSLVIIVDSNHDCSVEECQICQTIQLCLEKFNGFGKDDKEFVLPAICLVFLAVFCFSVICNDNFSTLVNQKIKLSY